MLKITSLAIVAGFLTFSSLNANASTHTIKFAPGMRKPILVDAPTEPSPIQPEKPVRQAKLKVEITKMSYVQDGANFSWRGERVCIKEGLVNVYKPTSDSWGVTTEGTAVTCPSTLGGKAVDVGLNGNVVVYKGSLFADEPPVEEKAADVFFTMITDANLPWAVAEAISKSDWSEMGFWLSAQPSYKCGSTSGITGSCSPQFPEYFTASAEIQDQ